MSALKYNKTVYRITGTNLAIRNILNSEDEAHKFASDILNLKPGHYNVIPETVVCR